MASNGSFNTTPYSNRHLTFSWSTASRSIEENYTQIYWELRGAGSNSQWLKTGPITLVIDEETVYNSSDRIQLANGTLVASGYKIIYHNSDGNRSFSASASAAVYTSSVNCWGDGRWDLDFIPRAAKITSASDFDDTSTQYTVQIDNPAGTALSVRACISWTGSDDIRYRELSAYEKENGYYTFNFTEDELNALRQATTNGSTSREVTIYITTYTSSSGWTRVGDASTKIVKFTVTNCMPVIKPTITDVGTVSTQLTGSDPEKPATAMIRGFNALWAAFNAVIPKGGSVKTSTITCGSITRHGDGYFEHAYDNTFEFVLTDNRGQTVRETVTVPAVDYVPVSCNVNYETELTEDNTANITITVSGNYFNGSFGAVNNRLDLQLMCGEKDSEDTVWEPVTPEYSDGRYVYVKRIEGADYKSTYIAKAYVADAINISGSYTKEEIIKIAPVFDWGENNFSFNIPVAIMGNPVRTLNDSSVVCKAYTQETDISYAANSYIKLFRDGSPTDLQNVDLVRFADNGIIYINKDMLALVNVHIVSQNPSGRSWIRLMNYSTNWKYTDCISYGEYTTSQITMIVKLTKGTSIGVVTAEAMNINASGLAGSYIEIYHL